MCVHVCVHVLLIQYCFKMWIILQLLTYRPLVPVAVWVCIYAGHPQLCSEYGLNRLSFSNDFTASAAVRRCSPRVCCVREKLHS